MRLLLRCLIAATAGFAPIALVAGPAAIDRDVRVRLDRDGAACVWVTLDDESLPGETDARVVARHAATQKRFCSSLPDGGFEVRYCFRFSPVVVLEVLDRALLERLEKHDDVARVQLDVRGSAALDESRALVRADQVFDMGITGAGTVVAVLDSGVDVDHPDLEGAIIHQKRFLDSGSSIGNSAEDGHGHGTHVTSIIAGRGRQAPRGVAPQAEIVAIKVLDDDNTGFLSDWTAGVEHVIELHDADNGIRIDVINMSFESEAAHRGVCDGFRMAFSAACTAARARGIALFAASGNAGSSRMLKAPACYSAVIAVGSSSVDPPDLVSSFTNRNELLDLLAPGESILAAGLGGGTGRLSGTSQASPHAAALACLLREIDPSITPRRILRLIQATGVPIADARTGLVFPRIDALAAVNSVALTLFHRGDTNQDGQLDIADPITTLNFLFRDGRAPACREAADSNNDGAIDISDPVLLITYLLLGGPGPDAPGPPGSPCGLDPDRRGSPGDLGCESYLPCL